MKIKVVEKCTFKREYDVDVDADADGAFDADDVMHRLYRGELTASDEECDNEVTLYDEDWNPIEV